MKPHITSVTVLMGDVRRRRWCIKGGWWFYYFGDTPAEAYRAWLSHQVGVHK